MLGIDDLISRRWNEKRSYRIFPKPKGRSSRKEILSEYDLLKGLTRQIAEPVLEAEMEVHLGYGKHELSGRLVTFERIR
ncbi:MAG TPA: hypothetical protein DCZ13_11250 [Porticoccaceae bacterium]|nr:hypothetical protein [Porticoccaceae bacterium]